MTLCKPTYIVPEWGVNLPILFLNGVPMNKYLSVTLTSRAGGKGTAGTAMAVPVFEGEKMASLAF